MSFSAGFAAGLAVGKKKWGNGGGGDDWQPWVRPSDWCILPEPQENQIIFLASSWGASTGASYFGANEDNNVSVTILETLPDSFSATVDWGDGNTSVLEKNGNRISWRNSNGFNKTAMYEHTVTETVTDAPINYYIYYDKDGKRHWNSGGTVLNDGTRVFIVTITVSNPELVSISNYCKWYPLEIHIGRNIDLDWSSGGARLLQHVKCFGWQPQNNKEGDLFSSAWALRKISATEPFTEIPDRDKFNPSGLFWEMDFSEVTRIGKRAFLPNSSYTDMGYGNPIVDLPKCIEIADEAFAQNGYITEINAPLVKKIGNQAFKTCNSLRKINIDSVEEIGNNCFEYCTKLEELNAPNLVSIGQNGLANCYNLEKFVPNNNLDLSNAYTNYSYLWHDNPKYPYAFDDVQ